MTDPGEPARPVTHETRRLVRFGRGPTLPPSLQRPVGSVMV
jgi:hypothetical protein